MSNVISFGAGVQSTALLLMSLHGEISPFPDHVIFADTGWEPRAVYEHLDDMMLLCKFRGVPFHTVSAGNIKDAIMGKADRFAAIPFHLKIVKGQRIVPAMLRRQCTSEYKIRPIQKKLRELCATRKNPANLMIGISTDEAVRAKPSRVQYIQHSFPLIDAGVSRWDCLQWMGSHGYKIPARSACIGCPYRRNEEWQDIKDDPADWASAVEADDAIREIEHPFAGTPYLHKSLTPLKDAKFQKDGPETMDMFDNECEGMCGL